MNQGNGIDENAADAVNAVSVVGVGTMGSGIAWLAAMAGHEVKVVDITPEATSFALERLAVDVRGYVDNGLLPQDRLGCLDSLIAVESIEEAVNGSDLVIEAVLENRDTKYEVLKRIGEASDKCIVATNTSSLPIDELATQIDVSDRFLGAHFFNPADWIPGVEVIPHDHTSDLAFDTLWRFLLRCGKSPARVSSSPGFIANRLQFALFREAARCVEDGLATPEAIDTVVRSTFGYRLPAYGPFQIADMAGLDVYKNIFDILEQRLGPHFSPPASLLNLIDSNRFGTKSGSGYREYADGEIEELLLSRNATYAAIGDATRNGDRDS